MLTRIARRIASSDGKVDDRLFRLMSKRAVVNYFFKLVDDLPGIHSYVDDSDWSHISAVFDRIRSSGVDLEVDTDPSRGGDYFYNENYSLKSLSQEDQKKAMHNGDALLGGKQWNIKVEFDGTKHWKLEGYVKAIFANPGFIGSKYEILFYLF